jgi:hypothetical protein
MVVVVMMLCCLLKGYERQMKLEMGWLEMRPRTKEINTYGLGHSSDLAFHPRAMLQ